MRRLKALLFNGTFDDILNCTIECVKCVVCDMLLLRFNLVRTNVLMLLCFHFLCFVFFISVVNIHGVCKCVNNIHVVVVFF